MSKRARKREEWPNTGPTTGVDYDRLEADMRRLSEEAKEAKRRQSEERGDSQGGSGTREPCGQ